MGVLAIGTDIVECLRIARMIERHGEQFLSRVYTDQEIRYCQSRSLATQHFAGRWAAKGAILKVLGKGWRRGINWHDVVILNGKNGQPEVILRGGARQVAQQKGIRRVLVSIAHCRGYATAYAMGLETEEVAESQLGPAL